MTERYINVTQEGAKHFYQQFHNKGKVVMLNLLRFRAVADYTNLESLKPEDDTSGKEAYRMYTEYTLPLLKKAGSKVLFYGSSQYFLIGPNLETWDQVLLVEHESVEKFMAFAQDPQYLKTAGHRTAALADSRLLPMVAYNS